jgi:nucleoside-diphosphate-sugar epimerase
LAWPGGYEVTVIDNLMFNQATLLDACFNDKFTFVRGDARDEKLVAKHIAKADYIFPLACLTGAPICDRDPIAARTTVYEAVKLITTLVSPDQRIMYPTTNSGYGVGQEGIYCTEDTPLNPISFYGKYKADAEKAVLDKKNCITFRLATVFGLSPRMRLDLLVNDFTYRAVADRFVVLFEAHFKRNYVHIRDVGKAFLYGMDNFDQMKNTCYNVGLSDANLSKYELCQEIQKQVPEFYFSVSEIGKDPDQRNYIVSNEKIEKCGFKTDVSLQKGIKELIQGYQIIRRNQYSNI